MPYLVRAFPVIRPRAELNAFLTELAGARREQTDAFYRQYGVVHESVHLQQDSQGNDLMIVVTQVENHQEAAPRFQAAVAEFEHWFKTQVYHLTGIDPNTQPLGPASAEVFRWEDR